MNIELFFDLVFIFCMRNIIPVLMQAQEVDWYTYYTFGFTFLLMLQIWLHATLLMNRYGTGDTFDRTSLITIMFLLFVMTHAISTGWEHYVVYNLSWVAILGVLAPVFLDVHVYLSVFIAVAALFGVFLFDRMLYFKLVPIEASKQAPTSNPKE